jgi:hypothetical protein
MGKITIIYQNGETISAPCSSLPLEKLQSMVGGYIESVPHFRSYEGEKCIAFCDEEGKLKGRQINLTATNLWHDQVPAIVGHDVLVGDILIVQGADLLGKL